MRIAGDAHLTYCTNVHPGESLREVREALCHKVTAVKARVSPNAAFGVGLRLSARAARELQEPRALADLQALLAREQLYVFTFNGFPYGPFHGSPVKQRVYLPDWRAPERLDYSVRLAELLAQLLPDGVAGSVSTVPGAFRSELRGADDERAMADNLLACAAALQQLYERSGRCVALAIEPEPACHLETTAEAVRFFERFLFDERAVSRLCELTGLARAAAADSLRRHLGVCLDACHAAVEFEDASETIAQLAAAGVEVKKLQLSAGLRIERVDDAARRALAPYAADEVYLHQVVERRGGALSRFVDLPQALEARAGASDAEWRVHFHVPVFLERLQHFGSTQGFLRELLALQRTRGVSRHLEVETYTWDVLPEEARTAELPDAIAQELRFCLSQLQDPA